MSIINFNTNFDGVLLPVVTKTVVTQAVGLNAAALALGTCAGALFGCGDIITKIDVFGTCTTQNIAANQTFSIYATNSTPFTSGALSVANTLAGQPLYLSIGATYVIPGTALCEPLVQDSWLQIVANDNTSATLSDPLNLCITYLSHAQLHN